VHIKTFTDIGNNDSALVGGKAASLGKLMQSGIPVPDGFVITTEVKETQLSPEITEEILKRFDGLGAERVAVRSSAVAEDSLAASWAGQLETFLNVSREDLIKRIRDCWDSINSIRVAAYIANKNINADEKAVAVIIQKMVDSEFAGVAFTANPINNYLDEIVIEAGWGLGESVVQGEITPETITISKKDFSIITKTPVRQDEMLVYRDSKNIKISAPETKEILSIEQTKALAALVAKVEGLYGRPMDVEWAYAKGKFYIVQARPITTLDKLKQTTQIDKNNARVITKGKVGSVGLVSGKARVVIGLSEIGKVREDEILIAAKTTPDYVEIFTKINGIVTDFGGATSHAAIISRELGIPAVVDTGDGTKKIKTGDIITVNGFAGEIYSGEVNGSEHKEGKEKYRIEKTGNEIEDLLNAMTGVYVDVRDLWPMPPVNLFPYFDVDQALSVYQKLGQLVEEGMPFKDIAKLFGRAEQIRYFLINTGAVSLKTAHNLKIGNITIDDQVKLVEWCIQILKELVREDPLCLKGKNIYWDQAAVDNFTSEYSWQEITEDYRGAVDKLSINLYSMSWSFYWNYYGAAGYDIHGPYQPKDFDGSQLIIKDYFNPAPTELWPLAQKVPFKSAMLAQIYKNTDIKISFGNRILNQDDLAGNNSHFVFIMDGVQITDLKEMQDIANKVSDITKRQTHYVNTMEKMDIARMCAKLSFYIHKDFFLHFGKDWYPEQEIENTIKLLGRKFIDMPPPKEDRTPEFRRQMLDPRNYTAP
jgi:phosphohistidine swiveling domain-containing protein